MWKCFDCGSVLNVLGVNCLGVGGVGVGRLCETF